MPKKFVDKLAIYDTMVHWLVGLFRPLLKQIS